MTVVRAILTGPFQARTWREFAAVLLGAIVAAPAFALVPLGVVFTVLSLLTIGLPPCCGRPAARSAGSGRRRGCCWAGTGRVRGR